MTERPGGGPDDGSQRPRDDQWTSVDDPGQRVYPGEHPATRAFEAPQGDPWGRPGPDQGYPATGYQQQPYPYDQNPYPQNPYPQNAYEQGGYQQQYGQQSFDSQPYDQPGQYVSGPGTDGAVVDERGSSRTLWLIAAVVALLVVVVLVAGYFLVRGSDDTSVADSSPIAIPTTENLIPPGQESEPPTAAVPGNEPSASAAPGQILYTLSGQGQVLGVTYAAQNTTKISPVLISPPWSVAADVTGRASLVALVLQGQVTCTITLDGQVLDTQTSSTGLLRCQTPER